MSTSSVRSSVSRSKIDPGGMLPYQQEFAKHITRDFTNLISHVKAVVEENDALNLAQNQVREPSDFGGSPAEAERRFLEWFDSSLDTVVETEEYDGYVERGYRRGLVHADRELEAVGEDTSRLDPAAVGGAIGLVGIVASRTRHRRRRENVVDQNRRGIEKVKEDVRGEVARSVDQSIRNGGDHTDVSEAVVDRIEKVGVTNGRTHAMTSTALAHSDATIERFDEVGIERLELFAEYRSAGDDRVCELCAPKHGQRFTIRDARGVLPIHPHCRCVFVAGTRGS